MPRTRSYHLHLPMIHADNNRELNLLYFNRVVRDLVNKLSFFFLPIYLFQMGKEHIFNQLDLPQTQQGILMIVVFHLIYRLITGLSAISLNQFATKIGYQSTMVLSYLLRIVFFTALFYTTKQPQLVWLALVLEAVQSNLFWPGYYTMISKNAHRSKMGADMGVLRIALQLVAMISPALAGFVSTQLGLSILFLFGIVGTLIGLIISLLSHQTQDRDKISWREFFAWAKDPLFGRWALSVGGRYLHDAGIYLWPLYVYFVLGSIEKVGYVYTTALVLAFLFSFLLAGVIDKIRTRKSFKMSGGFLSVLWLVRTQVFSAWSIAFVDMMEKMTSNFHWLYFDMLFMRRGKGSQAHSYFVYQEVAVGLAGVVFWGLVGVTFLIGRSWETVFVIASIGVLLSALMTEEHHHQSEGA